MRSVPPTSGAEVARSLVERIFDPSLDPERLAFVTTDGSELSLGDLKDLVDVRAGRLREIGVRSGVPVALFADDGVDLPLAYLAVIAAGGTAVPVNNRFGPGDVEDIARIVGPAVWLVTPDRAPLVSAALDSAIAAHPRDIHDIESCEPLVDRHDAPGVRRTLPVLADPSDPVDVLAFTSGTTGTPKGACLRRSALDVALTSSARSYRFTSQTVLLYSAAMAFVPTVLTQLLGTLAAGGRVHLLSSRDPEAWLSQAERVGATFTYVPSPELAAFAAAAEKRSGAPSIRTIFHAGSAVPHEVMEHALAVFGDRMLEAWGMTETCGAPITATVEGDLAALGPQRFARSVGRPVPEAVVRVDSPDGEGELVVGAMFLCHGYLDGDGYQPIDRRAFATGDLGELEGGVVSITGRRKELIITGGINVSPVEVEMCVSTLDGVIDAAAFGVDDPRWGEAVSVALVLEPGAAVDAAAVIEHVKSRLAPFKAPKHVHIVSNLPRTASQKVMRHVLRERFSQPQQGASDV